MAIGTDSAINFFGTQYYLTAGGVSPSTSSVANGAFSVSGDVISGNWTNDDDAPMASVVAMFDWNTTAPDAGSSVNLYARLMGIDGANNQDTPDANYLHKYLGSFPVNDVLTNQYIAIDITLPNTVTSQEYQFYIENKTGRTIEANWTMRITPKTIGPHA